MSARSISSRCPSSRVAARSATTSWKPASSAPLTTARPARALNDAVWGLPAVGASDAHFLRAIGSAGTVFAGSSAQDLRRAIEGGKTQGFEGRYPAWREIGVAPALAMTVAGLRATPKALGWRRTGWSFVSRHFAS